jgi:uncharacterized membrane protein
VRRVAAWLTAAAAVWVAVILASPVALARGRFPVVTLAAYQGGALICHQRPERSFHLSGIQMPVCARCLGLYAGGAAGLVAAWFLGRKLATNTVRMLLLVGALPLAATVAFEWLGLMHTTNVERLLTGLPLGIAAGVVIVRELAAGRSD